MVWGHSRLSREPGKRLKMMMGVVIMAAVTIIECSRARHRLRALHARSQSCPQPFEVKAKVLGLHSGPASPLWLCNRGQMTQPLCASVSSSLRQGGRQYPPRRMDGVLVSVSHTHSRAVTGMDQALGTTADIITTFILQMKKE